MSRSFVMINVFNRAYEDLGWVDYFTIDKITDDAVYIKIYTKKEISKEDDEFDTLVLRNISIGKELHREVFWDYTSSSKNIFVNWFRKLCSKHK